MLKLRIFLLLGILASYAYLQFMKSAPSETLSASTSTPSLSDNTIETMPSTAVTESSGVRQHSVNMDDMALLKAYDEALLIELNESHTLEQAIQIAKQKQKELAAGREIEPFIQQRELMDMTLWVHKLARNTQQVGELPEHALSALIEKSQQGNETDDQTYQYAQVLYQQLGVELTAETNKFLIEAIYTGEARQTMLEFETQRDNQMQQRDDYQQQLQVLLNTLDTQRQEQYVSLTEAEWRVVKNDKIKQFKLLYFK